MTDGWLRFLTQRALGAVTVIVTVATLAFVCLQFIPGDPAAAALGGPGSQASAEALSAARSQFGLDRPMLVQYTDFLWHLVRGDLGISYAQKIPVMQVLASAIGPTLAVTGLAFGFAWAFALLSVYVASGTSRMARALASALDLAAAAMPNFWLASLLVLLFSSVLGWFPAVSTGGFNGLILPALALAIPVAGFIAQVCRAGVDDAREAPFIESARSRGESEHGVRMRHIIRHGAVPGLNMTAWAFGSMLGGAAVIEVIFARPGLGRTLVNAVILRDIPVVLGVVLFAALAYVAITLIVDITVARIDPRTETRLQQLVPHG